MKLVTDNISQIKWAFWLSICLVINKPTHIFIIEFWNQFEALSAKSSNLGWKCKLHNRAREFEWDKNFENSRKPKTTLWICLILGIYRFYAIRKVIKKGWIDFMQLEKLLKRVNKYFFFLEKRKYVIDIWTVKNGFKSIFFFFRNFTD